MKIVMVVILTLFILNGCFSKKKLNASEVIVEGGVSLPVFESFGTNQVPEASLRMVTFRKDIIQIYYGEIERKIEGEVSIKNDQGEEVGTVEFSLPIRFGFVGVDAIAETDEWLRVGVSFGLAVFDKLDKAIDGTLWRFHIGAWIALGKENIVRLSVHHFSNGEDTPLKSPGPNRPLEFVTLGVGLNF